MAKKSFSAGTTKSGVLGNAGEKMKDLQARNQYNFKFIPKEQIKANPKNNMYSQDGIEALKESILINGLRHNLSVLYDVENNIYRLVSGERRFNAICSMDEKQYNNLFPTGIPCKVEKQSTSEIDEEIMLISANHDVREASMEVKRWEVSRLNELYKAKKLKGEISNINAEIAKQLNISERQARKYTTAEKLIPELSELLNSNGIDLNQADKFGKLDEEAQQSILSLIQKNGKIDNEEFKSIKKLSEEKAEEAKEYQAKYDAATRELEEKNEKLALLESRLNSIQSTPQPEKSKEDLEDELRYVTRAKDEAEKEKARLKTNLEKLKQQQKEKEQRKTAISDTELKRISSIAKTEQALNLLENNFDILKNNKTVIKSEADLRLRIEILKSRMDDLLNNL